MGVNGSENGERYVEVDLPCLLLPYEGMFVVGVMVPDSNPTTMICRSCLHESPWGARTRQLRSLTAIRVATGYKDPQLEAPE